jgi:hypothetical protein
MVEYVESWKGLASEKSLANLLNNLGQSAEVTAEITRPANTDNYAAGDAISSTIATAKQKETITVGGSVKQTQQETITLACTAPAKQKETITLSGTKSLKQKETITIGGTGPVSQVEKIELAGTAAVAQVDIITLTGTLPVKQISVVTMTGATGTATITIDDSVNTVTRDAVSIATSVETFAHDAGNLAEYLAKGIVLTHDGDTLVFTANVTGVGFTAPTIANASGDFDGTITSSTANVAAGTANLTIVGGDNKLITFNTDLDTTASDFASLHQNIDYYHDTFGIAITSNLHTIVFTAEDEGVVLPVTAVTTVTGNLAGVMSNDTPVTLDGTAEVSVIGSLTRLVTLHTTPAAAATAFAASWDTNYAAVGITLTADGDFIVFTATTPGNPMGVPVLGAAITGTITGTVTHPTANYPVGTATVAVPNTALSASLTYNTSVAQTVLNFKNTNATAYATAGIALTCSGDDLIFEALVAGVGFTHPTVANHTADLDDIANVVNQANYSIALGTATITGPGGLTRTITFDTDEDTTALNFKNTNAANYLSSAQNVVLTNVGHTLVFEAHDAGTAFTSPVTTTDTGDLAGVTTVQQVNIEIGDGTILAGGVSKTITYDTSINNTANAFASVANKSAYLAAGIVLTDVNNTLIFTANVSGTGFVSPTFTAGHGDMVGPTTVQQANVVIGRGTITAAGIGPFSVAFDTDADTTALAFVTANHDAFDAVGVELTNATNTIVMEAQVSGVPFTAPARVITAGDLTLSIAHTLANVTVDDVTLADMAIDFGGGGEIRNVWCETDAVQFAGKTITCLLFNDTPSGIVGDNVAFVDSFLNAAKRTGNAYFKITFDAVWGGSSRILGKVALMDGYLCKTTSRDLYMLVTSDEIVVAPKSGGVFKFHFEVKKYA